MIRHIAEHEFQMIVLESDKNLVVVEFWAPWCKSCQALHPILDAISRKFTTQIDIIKVNVDDEPRLAKISGAKSVPHLVFFKKSQVVGTEVGLKDEAYLTGLITSHLQSN